VRLLPALEPCRPLAWARGGHRQTMLAEVLTWRAPAVTGQRHEVQLPDGDELVVRHEPGRSGVLVHLLHGMTGDGSSDYVRGIAAALRDRGHGILVMNHRGCGEGRGLSRGIYHAGRKEDVAAVVAFGRQLEPRSVQVAVGVSLSGNALLLSLGDDNLAWPDAALAFNPPVDLEACSQAIHRGVCRLYEMRFVHRLRHLVRDRERAGLLHDPPHLPRRIGIRGFDDHFTAPLGGFADADDYYSSCSAGPHLARARIPAAIVTTADDPFVPVEDLVRAAEGTPVEVHVEDHGGHMGYLDSSPNRRWLAYAVPECVESLASAASNR
jgi:predicted alpha/beta-fold hydrolase